MCAWGRHRRIIKKILNKGGGDGVGGGGGGSQAGRTCLPSPPDSYSNGNYKMRLESRPFAFSYIHWHGKFYFRIRPYDV